MTLRVVVLVARWLKDVQLVGVADTAGLSERDSLWDNETRSETVADHVVVWESDTVAEGILVALFTVVVSGCRLLSVALFESVVLFECAVATVVCGKFTTVTTTKRTSQEALCPPSGIRPKCFAPPPRRWQYNSK